MEESVGVFFSCFWPRFFLLSFSMFDGLLKIDDLKAFSAHETKMDRSAKVLLFHGGKCYYWLTLM